MRQSFLLGLVALLALLPALVAGCARPREVGGYHLRVLPARQAGAPSDLPTVFVEIAARRDERTRGLSGRTSLPKDGGMLFIYREPREREFWMKDCHIALDIAFLDADGRIVALHDSVPPGAGLAYDDIPRAASGVPALYALETAAGWLSQNGLRVGDRVDVGRAVQGVRPD